MSEFDLVDWALTAWQWFSGVVAAASIIARLTPTPEDDAFVARLQSVLNVVAINPPQRMKGSDGE